MQLISALKLALKSRDVNAGGGLRSAYREVRSIGAQQMTEDWRAVADAINARMQELPLNQRDLSERSGVSVATIREVQYPSAPRRRSARTLGALSKALGWSEGYLRAVLHGEALPSASASASISAKPTSGDLDLVLFRLDQLHREVHRLADAVEYLINSDVTSSKQ